MNSDYSGGIYRGAYGGGVVVYCSEDVNCVRRAYLERNGLEALWVELKLNKKKH